jgi:hypothetical protein
VALYLARIPAGLAILVPLVAVGFAALCLVTAFEGTPQPTSVNEFGGNIPLNLSQPQLESYLLAHPGLVQQGFGPGPGPGGKGALQSSPSSAALVRSNIGSFYQTYLTDQASQRNPAANEMAKIGLWLELEVGLGFMIGLGLGSLTGQRTVTVIILIALQVILTPILAGHVIPYFLDGQRVVVGVAMDQLRPAGLASVSGLHGPGRAILGGRGALEIPPMPTWAMITDIVGWIVGWSVIGAWRMATRDA